MELSGFENLIQKTALWLPEMKRERASVHVARNPQILESVVFVGGHPGCGKTMLTPIVGSLQRVEIMKYNYALEHLCCLRLLGKIDHETATTMIRMQADLDIYNMMMSRETNFRFKDLSSPFKNPGMWRYIRRLFYRGNEESVKRIKKERPILHLCFHNLLVISSPLFEALGEKAKVIVVVRHPLYMIIQWHIYVEMYGIDPRDFTVWIDHEGRSVPFFTRGWEDKYLSSNPMDKTIYSIEHLTKLEEQVLQSLSEMERKQVLVIPFEYFVFDPWPYLQQIETLLETKRTKTTLREMKRQKVPRKMLAAGLKLPVYVDRCGWVPPEHGSERKELEKRRAYAEKLATPEAMKVLDQICADYERKYRLDYGLFTHA